MGWSLTAASEPDQSSDQEDCSWGSADQGPEEELHLGAGDAQAIFLDGVGTDAFEEQFAAEQPMGGVPAKIAIGFEFDQAVAEEIGIAGDDDPGSAPIAANAGDGTFFDGDGDRDSAGVRWIFAGALRVENDGFTFWTGEGEFDGCGSVRILAGGFPFGDRAGLEEGEA